MSGPISTDEAYRSIRAWYQDNVQEIAKEDGEYAQKSVRLIKALPPVEVATAVEKKAVFMHVMTMYLEWGYQRSDGVMKMSEYVKAAIGGDFYLNDDENEQLRASRLWPYLQR